MHHTHLNGCCPHQQSQDKINNKRSGEEGIRLNPYEFTALNPCRFEVTDQSTVRANLLQDLKAEAAKKGHKLVDAPYVTDNLTTTANYLGALYSQHRCSMMIRAFSAANNVTYDAILVLRPDVKHIKPVDLPQKLPLKHKIYIGHWASNNGVNDRGAYGDADTMLNVYMNRRDGLVDHLHDCPTFTNKDNGEDPNTAMPYPRTEHGCETSFIHAETFLKWRLQTHESGKIHVANSNMCFLRMRANGMVEKRDAQGSCSFNEPPCERTEEERKKEFGDVEAATCNQ
jgi:hypothetical protein